MTLTFPNVYFSVPGKWHNNYLKQSKINVVQVYILKQCSKISFECMVKNDNKSLSDLSQFWLSCLGPLVLLLPKL